MVEELPVKACKALEIGCGTGTDAIWLASRGFGVTAVDVSPIAIDMAKSADHNGGVDFEVYDFMHDDMAAGPFDFVFDRGYFHSYNTAEERRRLAKRVAGYLSDHGIWLSLIGSCDSPPREGGPPMRSAKDIIDATESFFEISLLKTSVFGSEREVPANIWVCMMKKRKYFR
jgi:SAM-dependent methyltransferase